MSSLAASQADGYYIPPSYHDAPRHQTSSGGTSSISKHNHPDDRHAGKPNQYLRHGLVRFELPHSGFCTSCEKYWSKGSRFNAAKKKVGMYYTTTVWEFQMGCRVSGCQGVFVLRTDPRRADFDYVKGIVTRLAAGKGHAETKTQAETQEEEEVLVHTNLPPSTPKNPLDVLANMSHAQRTSYTQRCQITALQHLRHKTTLHDAASNAILRQKYRTLRNTKKKALKKAQELGLGRGIEVGGGHEMQDEEEEDEERRLVRKVFVNKKDRLKQGMRKGGKAKERQLFSTLRGESIFDKTRKTPNQPTRRDVTRRKRQDTRKEAVAAANMEPKKKKTRIMHLSPNSAKRQLDSTQAIKDNHVLLKQIQDERHEEGNNASEKTTPSSSNTAKENTACSLTALTLCYDSSDAE